MTEKNSSKTFDRPFCKLKSFICSLTDERQNREKSGLKWKIQTRDFSRFFPLIKPKQPGVRSEKRELGIVKLFYYGIEITNLNNLYY